MTLEHHNPPAFDAGGAARTAVDEEYPELKPVMSRALDTGIASFYPEKVDAHLRAYLEEVTAVATVAIYAPIAAIAAKTGRVARDARIVRAAEVAQTAEHMAARVAGAAAALQTRDEVSALILAQDALTAANVLAGSEMSLGDQIDKAVAAAGVAAAVRDAAAAEILERAQAAFLVAEAATLAAAQVAALADSVIVGVELEVCESAAALRSIALATCYQVAMNVAASAAEAVLADGMPVSAGLSGTPTAD